MQGGVCIAWVYITPPPVYQPYQYIQGLRYAGGVMVTVSTLSVHPRATVRGAIVVRVMKRAMVGVRERGTARVNDRG